jgi:hypothetical protein
LSRGQTLLDSCEQEIGYFSSKAFTSYEKRGQNFSARVSGDFGAPMKASATSFFS